MTHTGVSVSPASGTAQNFTSPVTYTVTAEDGTSQAYTVTVTAANPSVFTLSFDKNASDADGTMEPVTAIDKFAFVACTNLTSITIPDSVTFIGGYAFASCSALYSAVIPYRVSVISEGLFARCENLTSVEFKGPVTSIGAKAFEICCRRDSVSIPASVRNIGDNAFSDCLSLASVHVGRYIPGGGPDITIIEGEIFSDHSAALKIYVPAAAVEKYKTAQGWSLYADCIQASN